MTQQEQSTTKPYLGDIRMMYQLCFQFVEMHLEMSASMSEGKLNPEEAARKSTELMQWMAWTLGGENPDFEPKPEWSGRPLGVHLRKIFAVELQQLSPQDAKTFSGPDETVMFALCRFMTEIHELIDVLQTHNENETEMDARHLHDLCVRWSEIFTGERFPELS